MDILDDSFFHLSPAEQTWFSNQFQAAGIETDDDCASSPPLDSANTIVLDVAYDSDTDGENWLKEQGLGLQDSNLSVFPSPPSSTSSAGARSFNERRKEEVDHGRLPFSMVVRGTSSVLRQIKTHMNTAAAAVKKKPKTVCRAVGDDDERNVKRRLNRRPLTNIRPSRKHRRDSATRRV